ncbi:MAG: hypothetical protein WBA62_21910 [Xanthobacteraceae bacterium]
MTPLERIRELAAVAQDARRILDKRVRGIREANFSLASLRMALDEIERLTSQK